MFSGNELSKLIATQLAFCGAVFAVVFYLLARGVEWLVSHISIAWN
jgi:hypothetical protein